MPVVDIINDILKISSAIKARVASHHPQHATLLILVETMTEVDTSVQGILLLSYPEAYAQALKAVRSNVTHTQAFVETLSEKFKAISPAQEARMLALGPKYSFFADYNDQILFHNTCVQQLLPILKAALNQPNRSQPIGSFAMSVAQASPQPPPPKSYREIIVRKQEPAQSNASGERTKLSKTREGVRVIPASKLQINHNALLGQGGFGAVFLAKGIKKGSKYAVKEINPERLSGKALTALQKEAELLAKLDHRNIVRLRGVCLENDYCGVVMEYVAGGTLYQLLRKHVLTWQEQLSIMLGVAEGLAYLHIVHRILHRDLKSPNILMKNGEIPQLCDFGLAKEISASQSSSIARHRAPGTPRWKAPELWLLAECTEETDVYAFGCVIYEVLSRKVPFEDLVSNRVENQVKAGVRPKLPEGTRPGIAALVGRCWDQRNTSRPKIGVVLEELTSIEASEFPKPGSFG